MLHRHISLLKDLKPEVSYIDEMTGEAITGIVVNVEHLSSECAFVYIASPYKDENDKVEGNIHYKDIMVFDNRSNTVEGWHLDTVLGNYRSRPNK